MGPILILYISTGGNHIDNSYVSVDTETGGLMQKYTDQFLLAYINECQKRERQSAVTEKVVKTYKCFDIESETTFNMTEEDFREAYNSKGFNFINYDSANDRVIDNTPHYNGDMQSLKFLLNSVNTVTVYERCENSYKLIKARSALFDGVSKRADTFTAHKDKIDVSCIDNMSKDGNFLYDGIKTVEKTESVDKAQKIVALMGLDSINIDDYGGLTFEDNSEFSRLVVPEGVTWANLRGLVKADFIKLPESCKQLRAARWRLEISDGALRMNGTLSNRYSSGKYPLSGDIQEIDLGGVEYIYNLNISDKPIGIKRLVCMNLKHIDTTEMNKVIFNVIETGKVDEVTIDKLKKKCEWLIVDGVKIKGGLEWRKG